MVVGWGVLGPEFYFDVPILYPDTNSTIKVKVLKSFPIFAQFVKVNFYQNRNLKHKK